MPNTMLVGHFNTHGPRWNPQCAAPLHHHFLEDLMDAHDLRYVGDGKDMHWQSGQQCYSVLDLVFATMELALHIHAAWLDDPAHATTSDHAAVWWSVTTGTQPTGSQPPTHGWAVGEWLADEASRRAAEQAWHHRSNGRPQLMDGCIAPEVESEAVWIRVQLTKILNQYAWCIRITARS
jgi:hypothetical protein